MAQAWLDFRKSARQTRYRPSRDRDNAANRAAGALKLFLLRTESRIPANSERTPLANASVNTLPDSSDRARTIAAILMTLLVAWDTAEFALQPVRRPPQTEILVLPTTCRCLPSSRSFARAPAGPFGARCSPALGNACSESWESGVHPRTRASAKWGPESRRC